MFKVPYDKDKPGDKAQLKCLQRAYEHYRGFGIFFQQRVGKTRVAIDFIGLKINEGFKRVLIVSPVCAQSGWKEQIKEYLGNTGTQIKLGVAKISSHTLPKPTTAQAIILLTTYDKLTLGYKDYLKWNPEIIVWDEAHLLKNRNSRRSKVAFYLRRKAQCALGLTGTPYSNRQYSDVFGIFRAINPDLFGTKWKDFENAYCEKGGYMGYEVIGYKNEDKILEKVDANSMRVLRKSVMSEPETEDIRVVVELTTEERRLYTQMQKNCVLMLEGEPRVTADMVTTQRLKLQQMTSGHVKDDEGKIVRVGNSKLEYTKDLIKTMLEESDDTRIIIVCKYIADIDILQTTFKVPYIMGSTAPKAREEEVAAWQKGIEIEHRILIIQEQCMSMGVDLSAANHMIFFSWGEDSITHSQVKDRLMGRNQKADVVHYHYMIVRKTIDELMYKALKKNITTAEKAANWKHWLVP